MAMLVGMGMPERVAEWTCEFPRERGSVLEQRGVDGKVAKLISAIHTHSWMQHECAKEVVVTARGGRRRHFRSGVRSGVGRNKTRLEALGPHVERTNCAGPTLLATCNSVSKRARLGDRRRPDQLIEDTGKVVAAVSSTFRRYGLKLNWRPTRARS